MAKKLETIITDLGLSRDFIFNEKFYEKISKLKKLQARAVMIVDKCAEEFEKMSTVPASSEHIHILNATDHIVTLIAHTVPSYSDVCYREICERGGGLMIARIKHRVIGRIIGGHASDACDKYLCFFAPHDKLDDLQKAPLLSWEVIPTGLVEVDIPAHYKTALLTKYEIERSNREHGKQKNSETSRCDCKKTHTNRNEGHNNTGTKVPAARSSAKERSRKPASDTKDSKN